MLLLKLISSLSEYKVFGSLNIEINQITDDSRKVNKGNLFIAVKGLNFDGHGFIPAAVAAGAKAIVGEDVPDKEVLKKIAFIKVPDSRKALSCLASVWYGRPTEKLKVIGVTGTDGKTTMVNLIYWLLTHSGKKTGMVSTVNAKIGNRIFDTGLHVTNPEPLVLQRFLKQMVRQKCNYAVLEVTSHGLDQERIAGIDFEIGVLTNITHEHLDYHRNYPNYLKAKAKLFLNSKLSILNKDDRSFTRLKKKVDKKTKVIAYDSRTLKGVTRKVVEKKFPEPYNRMNAAAAIVVAKQLGLKNEVIIKAIKSFPAVPGRMEEIKTGKDFRIFIDFAHTPNALKNVLKALKNQTNRRLIVVFGCAGERDKRKRPLMGKIATESADIAVFTAEDPRNEKVEDVIKEMTAGVIEIEKKEIYRIPDRGKAIAFSVRKLARAGDTVVICGKGHEKSMCYGQIEYPWSDREVVNAALRGRISKASYRNNY